MNEILGSFRSASVLHDQGSAGFTSPSFIASPQLRGCLSGIGEIIPFLNFAFLLYA